MEEKWSNRWGRRLVLLGAMALLLRRWWQKRRAVEIANSLVVVTGASQGIGAATARQMALRGARVILLARSADKLDELVNEIRTNGGMARAYAVDLADDEAVAQTAARLMRENGTPDIVIHNAGAGRWLAIDETHPQEARQMMAVPYLAAFYLTHHLLLPMLHRNRGHFVIVNSPVSFVVWPGAAGYAAARWAMRGLAEALRGDVAGSKINVSHVVAGEVSSNYFQNNPGTAGRLPKITRLFRTLTPEEVALIIAETIEENRPEVIEPPLLKLSLTLERIIPGSAAWLVRATGWRRPS